VVYGLWRVVNLWLLSGRSSLLDRVLSSVLSTERCNIFALLWILRSVEW